MAKGQTVRRAWASGLVSAARKGWAGLGGWRWGLVIVVLLGVLYLLLPLLPPEDDVTCFLEPAEGASDLVVLLHAFNGNKEDLEPMRTVIRGLGDEDSRELFGTLPDGIDRGQMKRLANADVMSCDMPFSTFSMTKPETVVAQLLKRIDDAWDAGAYERLYLVGHSMGGLFARKAYAVAAGETEEAPFEPKLEEELTLQSSSSDLENPGGSPSPTQRKQDLVPKRLWADKVERIVLMAGMNRGWSISHHMSISRAAGMTAGVLAGELIRFRGRTGSKGPENRPPLIMSMRRGSPFITNLRIQWLEMRRRANEMQSRGVESPAGAATTIQLLGSVDDLVSPQDNLDLVSGRDFVYVDVGFSGHRCVIDMADGGDSDCADSDAGWLLKARQERARKFALALTGNLEELRDRDEMSELRPDRTECELAAPAGRTEARSTESSPARPAESASSPSSPVDTHVVFVIHGIRDEGYWTRKIVRRVSQLARQRDRELERDSETRVVPETSTYGYFPMLPFLSSRARRQKVEWLMDRYTEARACHPGARFHYVGHSNGTYLLAKALEEYPSVRFDNVVFAGSVVRTGYNWSQAIDRDQVKKVLNLVASGDWVVALFPKGLELIGWQDLGSAGHDGFDQEVPVPGLVELLDGQKRWYVDGGHSAALEEEFWDAIARFVLDDPDPQEFTDSLIADEELSAKLVKERDKRIAVAGVLAPLIWLRIVALLGLGLWGFVRWRRRWRRRGAPVWLHTLIVLAYLLLIWTVITRL